MPAGKPWVTSAPKFLAVPTAEPFWHVYRKPYEATAYNPVSKARLALVGGTHAMYYVSNTLAGALWESVLRDTLVRPDLTCDVQTWALRDCYAVQVRLLRTDTPRLALEHPLRRQLFDLGSAEDLAVDHLLRTPIHSDTHSEAQQLVQDLAAAGITDLPMLSWSSRQHQASTVYLSYAPPMDSTDWDVVTGTEVPLDDPAHDYPAIRAEIKRCGFEWPKLATAATLPGPKDAE